MKKLKFNKKREYDWLIISQSYFQCALISARILRKELNEFAAEEGSPEEYCLKEIYGDYSQDPAYLIFPTLFNLKHGIEIYLKAIIGMANSEFPKSHDLLKILKKTNITDEKIEICIKKYASSLLLLPTNTRDDVYNEFERYPQDSPYDNLELFPAISDGGEKIGLPKNMNFAQYLNFLEKNKAEIKPIINQEKVAELIEDIQFLYKSIRKISLNSKDGKASFLF